MRHINGCDRGHSVITESPKTLGVVTGSPKGLWCGYGSPKTFELGHRVTEGFLVWSRGHKNFSALLHGVTEQCCAEQSQRTSHVYPMVLQVPSSSAAHALSESILY